MNLHKGELIEEIGSSISNKVGRVQRLRKRMTSISPEICIERAHSVTESYKQTEADPIVLRRAKALERVLSEMSIYIEDDELIVGNQASKPRAAPIFPEYSIDWIEQELDEFEKRSGDRFFISGENRKGLKRIFRYWRKKTVKERVFSTLPQFVRIAEKMGVINNEGNYTSGDGHIVVDFERVLDKGLLGVTREVKDQLETSDLADSIYLRKKPFLEAALIVCEAAIDFAKRYSQRAKQMGENEEDSQRKKELLQIANVCSWVPANPPRNFHEAIQCIWFVQLILQIESNGHSVSLGRFDQYMYAFYKKDFRKGILTREKVSELVECLWIKLFSINKIRPWSQSHYNSGYPTYQNVTIGGQTKEGEDAVNELSYICLDAVAETRLTEPNLYVRIHNRTPENYLYKCAQVVKKGFGMPAFVNDEIIIPSLLARKVAVKDAYNYSMVGCVEAAVPGKWGYRPTGMSFFNMMKVLELALNDGKDPITGIRLCPGNGDLTTFASFDETMRAWEKQVKFYVKTHVTLDAVIDHALEDLTPDVFCSALVNNCIKRGKTIKEGGAIYDFVSGIQVGLANLANSLAAIKKLVFEDKSIGPYELKRALNSNFKGIRGERIRQILINKAPKYGNDDSRVDILGRKAFDYYIKEIENYKNTRYARGPIGGTYYPSTATVSANVPMGAAVQATPDGRKAHQPLAEGASPAQGTDKLGPTAVVKSLSKMPTMLMTGGQLLNLRFSPSMLKSESELNNFAVFIKTFFKDLEGWHVQFNVVSSKVLKKAQEQPEQYSDLIVRVAGYCAHFTSLTPETQNDIIRRTEHHEFK